MRSMKQIAEPRTMRRSSSIGGGLRIAVTLVLVLTSVVVVPPASGCPARGKSQGVRSAIQRSNPSVLQRVSK